MFHRLRSALAGVLHEPQSEERLESIVARQRALRSADVQARLSEQRTDPRVEDDTAPLYGSSAYTTPDAPADGAADLRSNRD